MQTRHKVFDDLAQMAGGAIGIASNFKQQIKDEISVRVEEIADRLDFVPREDFDRLETRMNKAQDDILLLKEQLEALNGSKKKLKKT